MSRTTTPPLLSPELERAQRMTDFACACGESLEMEILVARVSALLSEWIQADLLVVAMPNGLVNGKSATYIGSRQPLLHTAERELLNQVVYTFDEIGLDSPDPEHMELVQTANLVPLRASSRADTVYEIWRAPLMIDGELVGFLGLYGFQDWLFSRRSVQMLNAMVPIITQAIANARRFAELLVRTTEDPLTGALNRRGFESTLHRECQRAERNARDLGLVMIDVDYFKEINDRFGHPVGDEVLREIVSRMKEVLRCSDAICRLGGDEFAVILPEVNLSTAKQIAERLARACASIFAGGSDGIAVTQSMGVAVLNSRDQYRPDHLARRADEALYASKRGGRARVSQIG